MSQYPLCPSLTNFLGSSLNSSKPRYFLFLESTIEVFSEIAYLKVTVTLKASSVIVINLISRRDSRLVSHRCFFACFPPLFAFLLCLFSPASSPLIDFLFYLVRAVVHHVQDPVQVPTVSCFHSVIDLKTRQK